VIINARIDQRARRVDAVCDSVVSDADQRPRSLVARVIPLMLGNGLALVGTTGPMLLLPRVLAALTVNYMSDLDAAAEAVRTVLPRFVENEQQRRGAAGRPATLLFGLDAAMAVCGYRITIAAGRSEVQRLRHNVCEPDLDGLAQQVAGVTDLADVASVQLEWLAARGVVGGGRLVHFGLTDRLLIRVLERQVPGGPEIMARLETGRVTAAA
jgi:hypothetical protein